ncbi:SDR family oxidoreductase [uncultured Microbacterium sp.]|mgnify:CR=1 FL=1|uniref:SDR family oxidoreductase n=1 Tax=uncultured Microbacterium sp. TaxID=191216 RepID=UPI0025D32C36|nr:SDR family oxidoreductase [uncultured Microbacterium sp.]
MNTESPVVVVTGTSSGMGLHAAVDLAARGCRVVATVRSLDRAGALREAASERGVELDVRVLDVTDHAAGRALLDAVVADHGRLDVLVNNAGRGCVGTAEDLSMDTVREQMETNYFSVVALTQAALPHMRGQGRGTILTVTSVGGAVGQPFSEAYCAAKFAVEGFMQSLAPVALAHGVRVSVIEPAAVASEFVANVEVAGGEDSPYAPQLSAYRARSQATFAQAQSAQSAGEAIADAALASDYRFRHQTGDAARTFVERSLADLDGSAVVDMTREWIA